jgi:Ca2+-binding RTX toxin-like protein
MWGSGRLSIGLLVVAIVLLVAPGLASATVQATVAGDALTFADSPGDSASIIVTPAAAISFAPPNPPPNVISPSLPDRYEISVTGTNLTLGPPCQAEQPTPPVTGAGWCPAAGIARLGFDVGDGDDAIGFGTTVPAQRLAVAVAVTAALGDGNDHAGLNTGIVTSASVDAGTGNDAATIVATGDVSATGGPGNDEIDATSRAGNVTLDGGDGNDRLQASATAPRVASVRGGAGNDTLGAQGGANLVEGGTGNDQLDMTAADGDRDAYDCGPGDDVLAARVGISAPAEDTFTTDCPPLPGVLTLSRRGRIVLAGGASTATLALRASAPLDLVRVRLIRSNGFAKPTTLLATLRGLRLRGSGRLRFHLGPKARRKLAHKRSTNLFVTGTIRRAGASSDPAAISSRHIFAFSIVRRR